jgi:carbonic anhydrase
LCSESRRAANGAAEFFAARGHHSRIGDSAARIRQRGNNAVRSNVAMTVDRLKTTAPILKAAADDNKLRVVGGVYALKSGRVELLS